MTSSLGSASKGEASSTPPTGALLTSRPWSIPMYRARWRHDQAAGKQHLSIADGWRDSWQRRVVTWRWEDWREEMPWMSLYFSAAVWISLGMAAASGESPPRRHMSVTEAD